MLLSSIVDSDFCHIFTCHVIPDSNFFPDLLILQVFLVLKSVFTKDASYRIVKENIGSLKLEEDCTVNKGETFSFRSIIMNMMILAITLFSGSFSALFSEKMYSVERPP